MVDIPYLKASTCVAGKVLDYGSKLMTGRWQRLQSIFASSDRFSGQVWFKPFYIYLLTGLEILKSV